MNSAIEKTISLSLLLGIGLLLNKKVTNQQQLNGIKTVILSAILPATIFESLLKIKVEFALLFLPIIALAFNFIILWAFRYFLPLFGLRQETPAARTLLMLIPSFAPGLSSFPYIKEYLGEQPLAWAALADIGNKVFGLIFLYLLAMHWFSRYQNNSAKASKKDLNKLLISLVNEPINLIVVLSFIFLGFGIGFDRLPFFIQDTVARTSSIMTPLVLLFIGMAVKVTWREISQIGLLLCWRAGISLCFSALTIVLLPMSSEAMTLLAIVLPLSSCSFWPYAHMSAINALQEKSSDSQNQSQFFDLKLGLGVLALSLPFSTLLVLIVCNAKAFFINPTHLLAVGVSLVVLSSLAFALKYLTNRSKVRRYSNRYAARKSSSRPKQILAKLKA